MKVGILYICTGKYIVFKFGNDNIYLDEVYIYAQTTIDEVKKDADQSDAGGPAGHQLLFAGG